MSTESIQGMIGHFGLHDWWLHELSEDDRELILAPTTRPDDDDETSLLHGTGFITSQNPSFFLTILAGWFMGADPKSENWRCEWRTRHGS